jgi:hypothetical protein
MELRAQAVSNGVFGYVCWISTGVASIPLVCFVVFRQHDYFNSAFISCPQCIVTDIGCLIVIDINVGG